ncbi:MAG: SDR family NAD(P)-dependent oxidoreductase [Candidatus Caldatribacterium sp.]|nr:SDR family NAD(P)-dependent oxidoreductase [Candidatus Caldatribacterium sp.]
MPELAPGTWAFVTGASSGIGEAFAYALSQRGMNLILLGRSEKDLQRVAEKIAKEHGTETVTLRCDLTRELDKAVEVLEEFEVELLVNNAGAGVHGEFLSVPSSRHREIIELNVAALTELSFHAGKQMVERKRGGIINVGSLAGFFPLPHFAVYAATKAYVYSLSLALWAEWKKHNVHVLYVAPGPTESKFFERARGGMKRPEKTSFVMQPEEVVKGALLAYEQGKAVYIPGWRNRVLPLFVRRLFPDWMVARFAERYPYK